MRAPAARMPPWRRLWRYTAGSAISFGVAEVTLVIVFGTHLLGAAGASVVASIVGIIPGYTLNRSWTWGVRGRSDFWREVVPYWALALFSTVAAALVLRAVNAAFLDQSRGVRTAINAVAYLATYGVLFVAKFIVFDRLLFADRRPAVPAGTSPR